MKKRKVVEAFCKGRYAVINNRNLDELRTVKDFIEVSIDPAPTNYGLEITRRTLGHNPKFASSIVLCEVSRKKFNYHYDEKSCLLYEEMIDYLNSFYDYYTQCEATVVIIERQTNTSQINEKITQHTETFFSLLARIVKNKMFVVEIAADERRKFLGIPRGQGKTIIKKASVDACDKLLYLRADYQGRKKMTQYSDRLHDISDCVNQAEALFNIIQIAMTLPEVISYDDV